MASTLLPISVDSSLGAMFIGVVLTSCLYGLTTLQAYIYFGRGVNDHWFLRYLVLFVIILNTLHMVFITHAAYTYMITDFTQLLEILKPTWTIFPATVLTVVSDPSSSGAIADLAELQLSAGSQQRYHQRGSLLSNLAFGRNWLLATVISVCILVTVGTCLAYPFIGMGFRTWFSLEEYSWLLSFSLAGSMSADILIAVSLCILFSKKRTGFARSDSILRALTIYSVNSGVLSSVCALLCLVTYVTMPHNFIFMTFYSIYPELVLNCLLATLNAREALNETASKLPPSLTATIPSGIHGIRCGNSVGSVLDINIGMAATSNSNLTGSAFDLEMQLRNGAEATKADYL
ncbi:hypothetical protein BD413DRAFT_609009 [Trametes elegans]|nr:hypothetical protein BD413DRAFT_609009 [Trametes elegans]